MSVIRRHVVVRGHVQGVFFRDSVRRRAQERGVGGSVRNRADGSVEGVFEGDAGAVDSLVEYCRTGPRGAHVQNVSVTEEEPRGERGFEVA
jgi:acylphosphatase